MQTNHQSYEDHINVPVLDSEPDQNTVLADNSETISYHKYIDSCGLWRPDSSH